jgi:hypothetical protein
MHPDWPLRMDNDRAVWADHTRLFRSAFMATRPEIPQPDTIDPQSPPEVPDQPSPDESPYDEPPGFEPGSPQETPPPPD